MPRETKPESHAELPATETPPPAKKFDESLAELEVIVARLERGDLPLETALAEFEAGIALVRTLTQHLSEAEARIEVLTRDADGGVQLQPFDRKEGNS